MEKRGLLYEGKAKKLFVTDDPSLLWVEYKDEATAFNGEKKDNMTGKGRLNNEISSILFDSLHASGIATHFVQRLSETEQLVKKTDIIPLEVVVRNIVAGSLKKRTGMSEGEELAPAIVEFYYKDDDLGDPLINEDHIRALQAATGEQVQELKKQALEINETLKSYFLENDLLLVDFKLEFGVAQEGTVLLADEISPDTCRLWDKDTKEKFDKDLYRFGIGNLQDGYSEILKRLGGAKHG
ncbi:phosphoribosylaminoimidazolesuccinocarboxamide synthase [Bacillus sp. FJAT-44742]|uniref:phosphoribosylaminoimidazolesuccinocarboxamide synthase n=1 Tax=Bacillus sp. FJAT-44742 TaxID=2014005 RepID=UPI000C24108F|nr:phosphoribosylaminoimidazolesuccinocarboxamide synthase [Bacillus sp. FJAT-44742]